MATYKLFSVYFLAILLLTKYAFLKILYGIDTSQIEMHYADVLFNDNLSPSEQLNLANRMGAIWAQMSIEKNLDMLERKCAKMSRGEQKIMLMHIKVVRSELEDIKQSVPMEVTFTRVNMCYLWQMALGMANRKVSLTAGVPRQHTGFPDFDCSTLDNLLAQQSKEKGGKKELPKWAKAFAEFFSNIHLTALQMLLKVDGKERQYKMADWLGSMKLGGETQLSHTFRTMHLQGEIERIKRIKQRMVHNFISHFDLVRLQWVHPIRLAAGFMDEISLRTYYNLLFCHNNKETEDFLEYAILCSQILEYFLHRNGAISDAESTNNAVLWKSFVDLTSQIVLITQNDGTTQMIRNNNNLAALNKFWHILKEQENSYGKTIQTMNDQMPRHLLDNLAKCLSNFLAENEEFSKCFRQQSGRRKLLREMIKKAEKELGGDIVPDQFWHLFEENKESTSQLEEQNEEQQQQRKIYDFTMLIRIKDICPDKKFSLKEIKENLRFHNDEELFSYELMQQYIELLLKQLPAEAEHSDTDADEQPHHLLLRIIENKAITLYYRERVMKLFKRALIDQHHDPEHIEEDQQKKQFQVKINNYWTKWLAFVNEWHQAEEEEKKTANWWDKTLCKCYQFVHQMLRDKQLKAMDAKWQKVVEENVKEWGEGTAEELHGNKMVLFEKIVIFSEQKMQFHLINCAKEQNAKLLVAKFRTEYPLIEMVHLFALIVLISKFDEMRSVLCYETVENVAQIKHRIGAIASIELLDRLEMMFPTVLHYDFLTDERLIDMLFQQFEYQSGTVHAEIAEARTSTPLLLNLILAQQTKLTNNTMQMLSNLPEIRKILIQKIVNVKQTFFTKLTMATQEQRIMREALCPPLFLYLKLKNISMEKTKIKRVDELSKWHPNSECGTEEGVKRAILENRVLLRMQLFQIFITNPFELQLFIQKLSESSGAKTKFLKLLCPDATKIILPKSEDNALINSLWADDGSAANEIFSSELRLTQLYYNFLTMFDSMHWLMLKIRLDLFVFVKWAEAKIAAYLLMNNSLAARRCAKFWVRTKNLFMQLLDRSYDEPMDEIPNIQIFQFAFFNELNLYLEKILGGKNVWKSESAMNEELRKIVQKSQKAYEEVKIMGKLFAEEGEQRYGKIENKMLELRIETLSALAAQKKGIKETLGYLLKRLLDTEELPEFVGRETLILIWKEIAAKHFKSLAKKLEEKYDKTVADQSEELTSKKKKAKRKKDKNEKKTEEGVQETVTAENTVITVEDKAISARKDTLPVVREEHQLEQKDRITSLANGMKDNVVTVEGKMETVDFEASKTENNNNTKQAENSVISNGIESLSSSSSSSIDNNQREDSESTTFFSSTDEGTKLKEFADDQFLAQKYAEFVETFTMAQEQQIQNGDADGNASELVEMLNVGAIVNDISHRLEAIQWIDGDQWKNVQKKRSFSWWKSILEKEYSAQFIVPLYDFLREIWREMDKIGTNLDKNDKMGKSKSDQKGRNIQLISQQIHSRNIGLAMVEEKIKEEKMPKEQMEMVFLSLFGSAENGTDRNAKNNEIIMGFKRNLELIGEAVTQRKMDQKIFENYKNNDKFILFIEMKEKLNFTGKNAQIMPTEKWQELKFAEENERKMKEIEKLKNALKLEEGGRENFQNFMLKLNKIFERWSNEAQFQFPLLHFLKNSIAKLETICILPEGFDQSLIFGQVEECDQKERDECSDQSLFCTLCKALKNIKIIQKYPKNENSSNMPMLKIEADEVKIGVNFIEIPGFKHIPRIKFSAKQMEVFLVKYGQNIGKLKESDHFDEGVYWYEIGRRNTLRANYEKDADKIEKFDKITELFHQNRAKALRQRELVRERKEVLFVLAAHSMHLKLLELVLPKTDYLSLLNNYKLDDRFAVGTLERFRAIFAYLEKWAQNNSISSNEMGYLNAQIVLIMLTKVFLLFPNASVSFLIDKFFLIYSNWKWPMPIQLVEINKKTIAGEFLSWAPGREWMWRRKFALENFPKKIRKEKVKTIRTELAMAVITPIFPEQNAADNINISSAKVVQNELKRASDKIRRNRTELQQSSEAMFEPIHQIKFTEKYDHFILIFCNGTHLNVDIFCEFVGSRLRYELYEFVEKPLALWVLFCHVFPTAITPTGDECSAKREPKDIGLKNASLCTRAWLVGIEMAPNQRVNKAFKSKLKTNLQKKLEEKVKSEFENGQFHNVWLNSEIAERKDLQKWGIGANL